MKIKFTLIILLAMVVCMSCFGCSKDTSADDTNMSNSDETTSESNVEETEKVKYIYRTKYIQFEFVSDEQKAEWQNALASLLNNEKNPIYEKGEGLTGYSYLYPDKPCIEIGYQLALFDINVDGTPELLVNAGGGSAGNAFYYVYDIISGEEIGTLDGGHDHSWCVYFNQSTGKYEAIGQFEWRSGWMGKIRFVNKATITNTMAWDDTYLYETSLMCAYYDIDAAEVELTAEEIEEGIHASWEEIYPGVRFWVNGDSASIGTYFNAQDEFIENYIRITETGIQLIDWDDVTSEEDNVAIKAEKMATALISSSQKFIAPSQSNE